MSPDGTQVFFRQPGRVEVWDLPTDTWRTVETADYEQAAWTRDGELWLPGDGDAGRPDPWTGDNQYSQVVVGPGGAAELDWMEGAGAPTAGGPGQFANPEFLVAGEVGDPDLLALGIGTEQDLLLAGGLVQPRLRAVRCVVRRQLPRAGVAGRHPGPLPGQRVRRLPAAGCRDASWAEDAFTAFGQ